ncbi:FAD-binding protein [Rhodobacter sphaeroides]|jgi:D-lactate dehydrogenase (cytochrome)|uniref:D-lactate dehydrogenase (cytochrome) n=1 Tax=Cereibacter sphaeroides (strain ATCC 17023 / DSM 158 / JCM 6121 / CCUG 31486 / LMG 2827 / NBRC 12203 / NCIMB 8253 / ATH 2.4.1.) TaxID=272943 RepID=Q3J4L0_CERS4|nr:FAD-linked oxidase C-terminal domain-containing protein [Cereibacter sphaeroides]ABA78274.1 putative D-lactate dehydrogenase (cytochrome), FAD/FMN-containing oxidoreductase [Cereibacter sphaeroides 2.4.1]AMJ46633.1 2-hydroxy-acid oxidase [Cereibacter sphaeroides]ANS33346.1 2-hydroxy-acid oxidase [Cereibacter sphaeroides]ATN62389.1 2-hydroxy-acid oxidase [Cereibacter sphaeroides]AXC60496.1 FAD-binding protein [Cereibacter sphaeroides 2.4.1]
MRIDAALGDIEAVLGERLSRSRPVREQHAQSETHLHAGPPDAVAFPRSTAEVARIAEICTAHRVPMVGWGAGTSLEGHALALKGGVTIDFAQMDRILELRPEDMIVRVQPGLTREGLNAALRDTGLFFPVDPGADASLGGMAATRASGTTAVRYGTMRDNVLGLEVVLSDGRVIRTGTAAPKSSSGYDLTALMVGSEGTLGLITELTLRLHGQPEAVSAAVCAFPDMGAAVGCVIETIQHGIPMARIEFLDAASVTACNAYAQMEMPAVPHLLIEFHGTEAGVAEQAERFGEIAAEHGSADFQWATRTEDRARLWKMRHAAYRACLALRPGAEGWVTDVCVPISRLAEAVEETQADLAASPVPGPILGHVGDGNFHAILLVDPQSAEELAEAKRLSGRMAERALRLGGTVTGEHGIGFGKLGYMEAEHGAGWAVMGAIKQALDPLGLLNPGKMVASA